jgi:hypothetical protein
MNIKENIPFEKDKINPKENGRRLIVPMDPKELKPWLDI